MFIYSNEENLMGDGRANTMFDEHQLYIQFSSLPLPRGQSPYQETLTENRNSDDYFHGTLARIRDTK